GVYADTRLAQQLHATRPQSADITRCHHDTKPAVPKDFAHGSGARGHDWETGGHRFEKYDPEAFLPRREAEQRGPPVLRGEAHVGDVAEELHAGTKTEFLRAALQARELRTRADDAQDPAAS